MNQLEAMQVFVRVAEEASFTRAAERLGLLKTTVSMAVKHLEDSLGTRLLHRTTRRVSMTLDGHAYYERCKELISDFDNLQTMFQRSDAALRGRLRVDMPSGFARLHVIPRLPEFLKAHPQLVLEISCTDRYVDLVQEGFDCVLRAGAPRDPQLVARPIGHMTLVNCASADYLRRRGTPQTLEDLQKHDLVHYVTTLGTKSAGFEYPERGEYRYLPMTGSVVVNNSDAYTAACLAGFGLIQVPLLGVREYLDRGELVEVLGEYRPEPMPISLVYANRRNLAQRVRSFMEWLATMLHPLLAH